MVVENGLGAKDELKEDGKVHDMHRICYLEKHIAQMAEAVRDVVDLMGYTPWGWIDVVSASGGYGWEQNMQNVGALLDTETRKGSEFLRNTGWIENAVTLWERNMEQ